MTFARIVLALALLAPLSSGVASASRSLTLPSDVVVHGKAMRRGTYRVALSTTGDSITFYRRHVAVATFGCEAKAAPGLHATDLLFHRPDASGRPELVRLLLADEKLEVLLGDSLPLDDSLGGARVAADARPSRRAARQ